jgi:plasmid stabilization system protein ParE
VTVRFSKLAREELATQLAYLAATNPFAAARLGKAVRRALETLDADVADSAALELRDGRRVRRWLVPPLALFYVRRGEIVFVVRVRHGAQRPITR